jgi:hypothetical protein
MANYSTITGLLEEAADIETTTAKKSITASRMGKMLKGVINYFSVNIQNIISVSNRCTIALSSNIVITTEGIMYKLLVSDFDVVLNVDDTVFLKNQTDQGEIGIYQITTVGTVYYFATKIVYGQKLNKIYVKNGDNSGTWHRDGNGDTLSFVNISDSLGQIETILETINTSIEAL